MNCPTCGHTMTNGAKVALCLNCGHTQPFADTSAPSIDLTRRTPVAAPSQPSSPVTSSSVSQAPVTPAVITPSTSPVVIEPAQDVPPALPVSTPAVAPASSVPSGSFGVLPTPMSAPAAASVNPSSSMVGISGSDTPSLDASRGKGIRRIALAIGIPTLVILGGGAFAANAYYFHPKVALVGYAAKLVAAKTGTFTTSATYVAGSSSTETGLDRIKIAMNGTYDTSDKKNPKVDITATGQSGAYSLSAQLRVIESVLYFKLGKSDLLESLGIPLDTDWYKYAIDKTALSSKCQDNTNAELSYGSIPLKDTKFVSPSETVSGHKTAHYRATVDNTKLASFFDKLNKGASADCKIDFKQDDVKNLEMSYDLYTSKPFDRLEVHVLNSKSKDATEVTLDTSDYNRATSIIAPANATDISSLLSGLGLSDSSASSDTGTSNVSIKSRDTQRKTDIRSLRIAAEEYSSDHNGHYPATLADLLTDDSIGYVSLPEDPINKAPYIYAYTPSPKSCRSSCTGFQVSAKLEDPAATGTDISGGAIILSNISQ